MVDSRGARAAKEARTLLASSYLLASRVASRVASRLRVANRVAGRVAE